MERRIRTLSDILRVIEEKEKAVAVRTKKNQIIAEGDVEFGDKFTVPRGMTYDRAIAILQRMREDAETVTDFQHTFKYRPWDGAYAMTEVLKKRFGITLAKGTASFFGERPPRMLDVKTGVDTNVKVLWGNMNIPEWGDEGVFSTQANMDEDLGMVFTIVARAPKKHSKEIEEIFHEIEAFLKEHSIYRGKAVVGHENPDFLDFSSFHPEQVVYSEEAETLLNGTLWSVMKYTERMRSEDISRKRAVLLYGPYGSGKTLTGMLTAKIAVDNGWTFISARPGRDNLNDIMQMAKMYQPSVVFFEDVDAPASTAEDSAVSMMLDAFDGITSKGEEIAVMMTTNHLERIHKGMLRPGRLDAIIEISVLDRRGVESLLVSSFGPKLEDDIDFDKIYESMEGFLPAFVKEAGNRASFVAIERAEGSGNYKMSTEDIVTAAHSLRPQLEVMQKAQEGEKRPMLETVMGTTIMDALQGGKVVPDFEDEMGFSLSFDGR